MTDHDRRHPSGILIAEQEGRRASDIKVDPKDVLVAVSRLENALNTHIRNFNDYVKGDLAYKEDNKTALQNMKNLSVGWKLFLSVCGAIMLIGGAWFMIQKAFHK